MREISFVVPSQSNQNVLAHCDYFLYIIRYNRGASNTSSNTIKGWKCG